VALECTEPNKENKLNDLHLVTRTKCGSAPFGHIFMTFVLINRYKMTEFHPSNIMFSPLSPLFFYYYHFPSFWSSNGATFLDHRKSSFDNICIYIYISAAIILSPFFNHLSLTKNSFLVISSVVVFRATDQFSGCRTVNLCSVVNRLYHGFDGKAFLKTSVSLLEFISQPIVVLICDTNHSPFFPRL
jgi:hypothetical protein